jgi:hypothetical protein
MQPLTTQSDAELLDNLETKLGSLAARWRGAGNAQESALLVRQYQAVLRTMIELGYHQWLDVESELPDEYMPADYLSGDFLKNAPSTTP